MSEPVRKSMTVDAPPEKVLFVITDFEAYPSWQKEIESAHVRERDEHGRPRCVAMSAGAMGMSSRYEIEIQYSDDGIKWHLIDGDMMTRNDAHYVLTRNDAGGTDLELEMELDLKFNLPPFMLKQIIAKGVKDNLKAVKAVAEKSDPPHGAQNQSAR